MGLEPGDLQLWYGRVVEIESVTMAEQAMIKFTDAGGVEHNGVGQAELRPLFDPEKTETVLDGVQRAAAPHLNTNEKLHRIAELWFAAPAAGGRRRLRATRGAQSHDRELNGRRRPDRQDRYLLVRQEELGSLVRRFQLS
jgi:hypothetical protein